MTSQTTLNVSIEDLALLGLAMAFVAVWDLQARSRVPVRIFHCLRSASFLIPRRRRLVPES